MDVINMTQNSRSLLCSDPFRGVASLDRISTKSVNRSGHQEDASSDLEDEENSMDIDITDFSTDDEDGRVIEKDFGGQRPAECDFRRESSELGITSTLLRMSAANLRSAMDRFEKVGGEGKILFGKANPNSEEPLTMDTKQHSVKKKYATKNWLISDSPKRLAESGKFLF